MKDKVGGRVLGGILYSQAPINNDEGIVSRAGPPTRLSRGEQSRGPFIFPKNNAASVLSPRDQSASSLGTDQRTFPSGPSFSAFFFEDKRLNGSGRDRFTLILLSLFLGLVPPPSNHVSAFGLVYFPCHDASFSCQATRKTCLSNPAQPQNLIGMEKGNHVLLRWRISNQNMC